MTFSVSTDAIDSKSHYFDARYTCDADNSSPEVRWSNPPSGTQSFALIMDDPDAPRGVFTHWVVFAIPAEVRHLPAGIPAQEVLPNGIRQGLNTTRKLGYFGPCPPPGDTPHRYRLTLFALKRKIESNEKLNAEQLYALLQESIIARTETVGFYGRFVKRAS